MFIESLAIENLKLLRSVRISFMENDEARPWTVLIGENGTGKTSVLQAIAMAAAGPTQAGQLADVASLPDRRQTDPRTRIKARFEVGGPLDGPEQTFQDTAYRLVEGTIEIQAGTQRVKGTSHWVGDARQQGGRKRADDVIDVAQTSADSAWFAVAYGVHRELSASSTGERRSQLVTSRLAPLFDPRAPVLGPGFAEQMLDQSMARAFSRTLSKVLVSGGLLPGIAGLELRGRGGVRDTSTLVEGHRFELQTGRSTVKLPARWLSQGYQASIAWISDLVGHAMLHAGRPLESEEIEGLVLIDELDLFLHPAWQSQLIPALRATFPRVQFVATTHSPLVLTGLMPGEVHLVAMDEDGNVSVMPLDENPRLRTASELYSEFFGINGLSPTPQAGWLRRYGFVANNPFRTDADEVEMQDLRQRLEAHGVAVGFNPTKRVSIEEGPH